MCTTFWSFRELAYYQPREASHYKGHKADVWRMNVLIYIRNQDSTASGGMRQMCSLLSVFRTELILLLM